MYFKINFLKKQKRQRLNLVKDIVPEHQQLHALTILKSMFWGWNLKGLRDYYGEGETKRVFLKFLIISLSYQHSLKTFLKFQLHI